ncbi:MAG: glycosyltransferase family 4 protein [Verrucomicrobiales bacterium]|nr:glycosyltransferase family 4 protein [Verrucomicrobiales bacterium]
MIFGFVSTRFAGTDGVSLESSKWADVLLEMGHECRWFSGMSDRPTPVSYVVPEAHFEHPSIIESHRSLWGRNQLDKADAEKIELLRSHLREELSTFIANHHIETLVPQNALTIPMNIPLGLALHDIIRETGIKTLAHHHDFYWERERFSGDAVKHWLDEAFPPDLPSITHVVINSAAKEDLFTRRGIASTVIPNVMKFSSSCPPEDAYNDDLREAIGLSEGDRLILQPTRVVPRKGIELSIDLIARLNDPRNKLVISHDSGDEGHEYFDHLTALAEEKQVDLRMVADRIRTERSRNSKGEKCYTLRDLYPVADFVTFPSLYEGFGNALLEAIEFGKPTLVNRYSVFKDDIEPLGLDLVIIDGTITDKTVSQVKSCLENGFDGAKNRRLASEHFGYDVLRAKIEGLILDL